MILIRGLRDEESPVVSEAFCSVLDNASFVYIASFFLTVSPEAALIAAKHAVDNNKPFALNLSAPFLVQVELFRNRVLEMIPYATFVICNDDEARALGTAMEWGEDLREIGKKIVGMEGYVSRTVIFTCGASPALIINDAVIEVPAVTLPKEDIVDLNGAGDAFVGGFLAQYIGTNDLDAAVREGHRCASIVVQQSGCVLPSK